MNRTSTSITPKEQRANTVETLLSPGGQLQQADHSSLFKAKPGHITSPEDGFDLTQVPVHPKLRAATQVQCCAGDGSPCSCPKCMQASDTGDKAEEEKTQPVAQAPVVEATPIVESAPAVEATPPAEQAPVAAQAPVAEQSPAAEQAPAAEAAPSTEEAPRAEQAPGIGQAPAAEATPSAEQAPATEQTPVAAQAPAAETPVAAQSLTDEQAAAQQADQAPGAGRRSLIVEDSAADLSEGQMTKTAFLELLRSEIRTSIEPVLATKGQTTEGCPYLNYWLDHYQQSDASDVESAVKKYAPDAANARTAERYIAIVTRRALRAAEVWARTGRITEVPAGVSTDIPGETSSLEGGISIRAKAKSGGVRSGNDPQHIYHELGEGRPMDAGVRTRMEAAFGTSFSHVRTHTDPTAAGISNRVNARAFTVGNHIAFGGQEYKPGTLLGDALIAHELAHVMQQRGAEGEGAADKGQTSGASYDALENDADESAVSVVSNLWKSTGKPKIDPKPRRWSGLSLQRCSNSSSSPGASGSSAPARPTLTFATRSGPTQTPCGGFEWKIGWILNNVTSSTNGIIVQNVTLTRNVTDCANAAVVYNGQGLNPSWYPLWEAWNVNNGVIQQHVGNVNDIYGNGPLGNSTKGTMAVNGTAEYYDGATLPSSFTVTNAAPAWSLPMTNSAPATIPGGTGSVNHSLTATWDCCATPGGATTLTPTTPP